MKPGTKIETSMLVPLGILVALVKRKIGQGCPKSVIFVVRPSMSPLLGIICGVVINT